MSDIPKEKREKVRVILETGAAGNDGTEQAAATIVNNYYGPVTVHISAPNAGKKSDLVARNRLDKEHLGSARLLSSTFPRIVPPKR